MSLFTIPTLLGTLADCKEAMGIPAAMTADDALITRCVAGAYGAMEKYCHDIFLCPSTDYTEYYDGMGRNELILRHRPIVSITGLWDDADRIFDSGSLLVDGTDYYWDDRAKYGTIRRRSSLVFGYPINQKKMGVYQDMYANVKVAYKAGYIPKGGTPPAGARFTWIVPDGLLECVLTWAEFLYSKKIGGDTASASVNIGGISTSLLQDLPPDLLRLADTFRNLDLEM